MFEQAYLVALYRLCSNYHGGQWEKGYYLLCLCEQRLLREYQIKAQKQYHQLDSSPSLYPKGGTFRKAVAFWMKRLKRFRSSL